jgi:hypothetical protein
LEIELNHRGELPPKEWKKIIVGLETARAEAVTPF